MGLSVGYPPSLEELYRQMSSSPAFAQMMQRQDAKDGGGGSNDPRSWLQARMRTHGLNIPPMPQQAAPPQQMPSQAFSALGAPQGPPPQMAPQAPMPMGLPPMPQVQNRQSGGFLSGLIPEGGEFKERLGDMLMGFGGGRTWQDSLAQGGQAIAEGRRARAPLRAQTAQDNRTRQYAMQLGIPEDVAMGLDATNLMALIRGRYEAQNKPAAPIHVGDRLIDPKTFKPVYESPPDPPKAPEMEELFDEKTGLPYKAQWNPETGKYDRVGGTKAPSGTRLIFNKETGEFTFEQGSGLKLTESQSKDTGFAVRAEGASVNLDQYETALTSLPESTGGSVPIVGNYLKSDEYQMAQQAGNEFLTALLRKDSGATITPLEQSSYGEIFLPQPGDGKPVMAQKKAARARAIAGINAGLPPSAILAKEQALKSLPPTSPPPTEGGGEEWTIDENGEAVRVK